MAAIISYTDAQDKNIRELYYVPTYSSKDVELFELKCFVTIFEYCILFLIFIKKHFFLLIIINKYDVMFVK